MDAQGLRVRDHYHLNNFIAEIYKVCLSDVNQSLGQETCNQFRNEFGDKHVAFVHCDVTCSNSVSNLWQESTKFFKTNSVDLWVNNAGTVG